MAPVSSANMPDCRIRSWVASHSWTTLPRMQATPGARSLMGVIVGLSVPSWETSLIVVPEWTFRFSIPLYWSTTADSRRYHFPSSSTGAFALDQTTKRTAADSSATIPVWAIEGEGAAVSATTLHSTV